MTEDQSQPIARLLAKDAIAEALTRYCRGVDIPDLELIKSAYWPDATDDHIVFTGNAMVFADMAVEVLKKYRSSLHFITNLAVTMRDENHADAQSYYYVYHEHARASEDGPGTISIGAGRYLDKFERRGGEWRILARKVTSEWNETRQSENPAQALAAESARLRR